MIYNLLQALFGERTYSSEQVAVPETTIPKDSGTNDENLSDIERLEKHYGELHEGKVIQTTLQEILAVIPRKRARTDAYDSLVRQLERDYKVKLIITSRKHSKKRNQ
jgi:hypothetical protein